MSQPPYEPPTDPPNQPPTEPPPSPPPPPNPGQWMPPEPLPPPPGLFPGYGAPMPPPPPKSHTGLIIGLVLAGVAVFAGLLVAGLLVYADDDFDDDPSGATSTQSSANAPDTEVLEGDGYSYGLPDGWQDITDEVVASDPGTTLDTGSAWGDSIATGRANLIVEVTNAGGVTDLDEARDQLTANLETLGVSPQPVDNRTIGGQEAAGVSITRTNELDVEVLQTAYITIVDDTAYVITTTNEFSDDGPQDAYDAIYESWSWE